MHRALSGTAAVLVVVLASSLPAQGVVTSGAALEAPPVTATPDTLSLERAVRVTLARSPELRQAEAQAYAAGAGRLEGWGRLLPSIYASAGLNRGGVLQRTATDPITGAIVDLPDSLVQLRETFGTQAAFNVDWTVFTGGQEYLNIRRAEYEAAAARFSLSAARARIAAGVKLAYLDALEAEALLRVRKADAERASALVEAAQARFDVGETPEIDVLQARVASNDADLALTEAEIQAEGARLSLNLYLAGDVQDELVLLAPGQPAAVEWTPERVRACALGHSGELASLAARARAGEIARTAARWSFLPTIRIGATWSRSELGRTRDALTFEPRNEQTYYRMTMSWTPLDQPGQWLASRRRAAAQEAEASAVLATQRPAVERQLEIGLIRLQRARLLRERAELNVQLAARQREQASERYRLGLAPITEMIQAEALAREAERQAVTARFADQRALAELESAAGVDLESVESECPL